MSKPTIASIAAERDNAIAARNDLETILNNKIVGLSNETWQLAKERDRALDDLTTTKLRLETAMAEVERYKGMIEMLERLGKIPLSAKAPDPY